MSTSLLVAVFALAAAAPPADPLLSKKYGVGFAPPEMTQRSQCFIYADRVEVSTEQGVGNQRIEYSRPITLSNLESLIDDAAQGPIHKFEGPTDVPYRGYHAYKVGVEGGIDLGTVASETRTENKSPSAERLRDLIDTLCPAFW